MAIDDELVAKLIDKLHLKIKEYVDGEREMDRLLSSLISIRKLPMDSLPVDRFTGNIITEERRNEILESVIPNIAKFIGDE